MLVVSFITSFYRNYLLKKNDIKCYWLISDLENFRSKFRFLEIIFLENI